METIAIIILDTGSTNGEYLTYPVYSKIYYDYKFRIQNMPKHKDKSKSHQNNMAMRYMIKQLLTNLWVYWRKAENLAFTESYAVAKPNMNPHGFNY